MLVRLVALAALLHLATCLPEDDAAVPSDVKYIRRGVCQQLITAVHAQVAAAEKKSKSKKLSEDRASRRSSSRRASHRRRGESLSATPSGRAGWSVLEECFVLFVYCSVS